MKPTLKRHICVFWRLMMGERKILHQKAFQKKNKILFEMESHDDAHTSRFLSAENNTNILFAISAIEENINRKKSKQKYNKNLLRDLQLCYVNFIQMIFCFGYIRGLKRTLKIFHLKKKFSKFFQP